MPNMEAEMFLLPARVSESRSVQDLTTLGSKTVCSYCLLQKDVPSVGLASRICASSEWCGVRYGRAEHQVSQRACHAQELLASQKAELAQLHTRQTELQLAAVEREAAAQDLYVRLEAAQGDLCGERERGDQAAAQLAAAQQQLQVCMPVAML